MIIKIFDNGWGKHYLLKQFEQSVLTQMLAPVHHDSSRTIVINSVWYTGDYHETVMSWLRQNDFDHIVLVAMLDAAIPYPDRYDEFARPVSAVGYYAGQYHLDFWAMALQQFFRPMTQDTLLQTDRFDTAFMCLNRKPHWHRRRLYQMMQSRGLLHKGLVSMGSESGQSERSLAVDSAHDDLAPNASADHFGLPNDLISLGHLDNWQRCFLNVVTETCFNINQVGFVSEKIYKPIIGCRPFLVYDTDGASKWLQDRGFVTFVDDFGDICDLDLRESNNVCEFLHDLCNQPTAYLVKKFVDLRDKVLYNKGQFALHVQRQQMIIDKGIQCPT